MTCKFIAAWLRMRKCHTACFPIAMRSASTSAAINNQAAGFDSVATAAAAKATHSTLQRTTYIRTVAIATIYKVILRH